MASPSQQSQDSSPHSEFENDSQATMIGIWKQATEFEAVIQKSKKIHAAFGKSAEVGMSQKSDQEKVEDEEKTPASPKFLCDKMGPCRNGCINPDSPGPSPHTDSLSPTSVMEASLEKEARKDYEQATREIHEMDRDDEFVEEMVEDTFAPRDRKVESPSSTPVVRFRSPRFPDSPPVPQAPLQRSLSTAGPPKVSYNGYCAPNPEEDAEWLTQPFDKEAEMEVAEGAEDGDFGLGEVFGLKEATGGDKATVTHGIHTCVIDSNSLASSGVSEPF